MSRGRVCSLDVTRSFSYRKNCSLLSLARLLLDPVTHCSTSIRLSLSLLLREQSLDMRRKSQQDPNCPASAPQTQVCVCVHEGGQSTMFAFLPGVGTLPLPAASRGQARCARRTRWMKHGREGGGIRRAGDCCIFLWWLCCEGCASDLVKGESLPTSSLPWPWQWPLSLFLSLSSLFYHKNARRPRSTSI